MYLRGNVYYTDFYTRAGKRERISLKTSDDKAARKLEKRLVKLFEDQQPGSQEIILWSSFKKWYLGFLKDNRSPATLYIHKLAIKRLEAYKKPHLLREVTADLLLGFKAYLKKLANQHHNKPGPAGRNRIIKALKSMMKTAEKLGKIERLEKWDIVQAEKGETKNRIVWHSMEELRQIAGVLNGDLYTAFMLGWEEGLRRGEMVFLYKSDYNPRNHTITITSKSEWAPKTKKSARTIPLRPDTEKAIQDSIANNPHSIYIINCPGNRNTPTYLSYEYRRTVKQFLPHLHSFLHKLRHTYGTMLIKNGAHIKTVSDLMGHSNVLQTEKYIHLNVSDFASATALLPSLGK